MKELIRQVIDVEFLRENEKYGTIIRICGVEAEEVNHPKFGWCYRLKEPLWGHENVYATLSDEKLVFEDFPPFVRRVREISVFSD